mmetsp:Transcript_71/g.162  ORF Transcript_71/g.162 Transcript_71/m.162 type:complete len:685 (+) Transcript_71:143-2197(+)
MPHLKIFGQKSFIAGDDIGSLLIMHTIFNSTQVLLALVFLVGAIIENDSEAIQFLEDENNCVEEAKDEDTWTFVYSGTSVFLSSLNLCLVGPMLHYNGMGTPTDTGPREPLKRLCQFELVVVNILRITVSCFAIVLASRVLSYCECITENYSIDTIRKALLSCDFKNQGYITGYVCLAVTHCVDMIIAVYSVVMFVCRQEKCIANTQIMNMLSSERNCSLLMKCFLGCTGLVTCGIFGGDEAVRNDYANFSVLMANYLNGTGFPDVTGSDFYVGLYVTAMVNELKKIRTRNRLRRQHTQYLISKRTLSRLSSEPSTNTRTSSTVDTIDEEEMVPEISSDSSAIEVVRKELNNRSEGSIASGEKNAKRPQRSELLSSLNLMEVDLINEAAHFVLFAEAAYLVPGYMIRHPLTGGCSLLSLILRNCSCFSRARNESVENDGICNSRTIAMKAISGVEDEDIIYANYSDQVGEIPYIILLDHDWKSIVIAIRGTMSLESIVTDLDLRPKELTALGEECGFNGEGLFCHSGMLTSTEWLYRNIKDNGKLERVMADYKDYKLRILGHSLGAGVASILSVLLRPKYPQLRCLAFSPPGCVLSENLAIESENFTTSFVVNDDIIARITVENFEELRNGVLEMISRIKIPKYQVTKVVKKYDDSTEEGLSDAIDEILCKKRRYQRFQVQATS